MNNNNSNQLTQSRKTPKAQKGQDTKALARLRADLEETTRNPQAVERRRQAAAVNRMARSVQLARQPRPPKTLKAAPRHHKHLSAYAAQVADPRKHTGVPPLFTDNLVQTVQATQCKVTRVETVEVPAGRCIQICLLNSGNPNIGGYTTDTFAGGGHNSGAPGDELAMHERPIFCRDQFGNENYYTMGPILTEVQTLVGGSVSRTQVAPALGIRSEATSSTGLLAGTFATRCGSVGPVNAIGWQGLTPTSKPPYAGSQVGHSRVVNTGMCIELLNTTAQGNRGGDVTTVALPHELSIGNNIHDQSQLMRFKTFQVHAVDRPIYVSAPPRPVDMTYYHPSLNVGGNGSGATVADWMRSACSASLARASLFVFLNNPTAVPQTYRYEITANYSIGGDLVAPISVGVPISLETKPGVTQANVELSQKPATSPGAVFSAFKAAGERMAQAGLQLGVKALSPTGIMEDITMALPRLQL